MIIPWIGRATANSVLFCSTTSCFQSTPYTTKVHCSFGQRRQNPFGEIAIAYLGHNCSIFLPYYFGIFGTKSHWWTLLRSSLTSWLPCSYGLATFTRYAGIRPLPCLTCNVATPLDLTMAAKMWPHWNYSFSKLADKLGGSNKFYLPKIVPMLKRVSRVHLPHRLSIPKDNAEVKFNNVNPFGCFCDGVKFAEVAFYCP